MTPVLSLLVALASHSWPSRELSTMVHAPRLVRDHIASILTPLTPQSDPARMPPAWSATMGATSPSPFMHMTQWSLQSWDEDVELKRSSISTSMRLPFAPKAFEGTPKEFFNTTNFAVGTFSGVEINGQKLDGGFPGDPGKGFQDFFAWLPYATHSGPVIFNGTSCDEWSFAVPSQNLSLRMLGHAGEPYVTPVHWEENVTVPGLGAYKVKYDFLEFKPGGAQPVWKGFNQTEFTSPEPCPLPPSGALPKPVSVDMYVFHPVGDFTLASQDVGDPLGDTFFMCVEGLSRGAGRNNSVTHWTVELVPRFGQYQNCQGWGTERKCAGDEHFWVGHEAALAMGYPIAGQCETNDLTGEWYSLPKGGECKGSATPGDGTCTWRATHVKTVDAGCMLDEQHGFAQSCVAEKRAPFAQTARIFTSAFASDEPSKGGCPPLPGPAAAQAPAVSK
jgi:hypothetical protein